MVGDQPPRIDGAEPPAKSRAAVVRHAARRRLQRALRRKIVQAGRSAAAANPEVAAVVAGIVAFFAAGIVILVIITAVIVVSASSAAAQCSEGSEPTGTIVAGAGDPPAELIPWLVSAADQRRARLGARGPAVLAGIAKVETDFGRSDLPGVKSGVNFAGCCAGPFQFNLLDTWAGYADDPGADADGDGTVSVYSFPDAAFAAARKLRAGGAPRDWNAALLAYNRSSAYVAEVLAYADRYQGPIAGDGGEASVAVCAGPKDLPATLGALPADPLERINYVADWIESRRYPYCFGGGHGPKPGPDANHTYCKDVNGVKDFTSRDIGLDCSGAVRWLLTLTGYPDPGPISSSAFAGIYPSGVGEHVTIWSNTGEGMAGHVYVTIDDRPWGTAGGNYRHGAGWAPQATDGFMPSHPPGL